MNTIQNPREEITTYAENLLQCKVVLIVRGIRKFTIWTEKNFKMHSKEYELISEFAQLHGAEFYGFSGGKRPDFTPLQSI